MLGTEETKTSHYKLSPTSNSSQSESCLSPSITPIFTYIDKNIDEHDIDQSPSLTNKLFLEELSDQEILPTLLEEEPIFADKSNNTEPVNPQTTDESMYKCNGDSLPPIVSQTQTGINN